MVFFVFFFYTFHIFGVSDEPACGYVHEVFDSQVFQDPEAFFPIIKFFRSNISSKTTGTVILVN